MTASIRYDDWRDHLHQHGYVVIKNVLSSEKAEYYKQRQMDWLEKFPYGFKKDDSTTWNPEYLPAHARYPIS